MNYFCLARRATLQSLFSISNAGTLGRVFAYYVSSYFILFLPAIHCWSGHCHRNVDLHRFLLCSCRNSFLTDPLVLGLLFFFGEGKGDCGVLFVWFGFFCFWGFFVGLGGVFWFGVFVWFFAFGVSVCFSLFFFFKKYLGSSLWIWRCDCISGFEHLTIRQLCHGFFF